jgi:hypothetical protein
MLPLMDAGSASRSELPLSRRGFLVRSAGVSAVLALGACAPQRDEVYDQLLQGIPPPSTLPAREYAVLRAVARRLVPEVAGAPGADSVGAAVRIDRELAFHSPRLQNDLRDALRLIEWWPLATRFARFTRLDPAAQDAELAAMATSRLAVRRSAFQGLKLLVVFFTYTRPETWSRIGYLGPWVPQGPERTA